MHSSSGVRDRRRPQAIEQVVRVLLEQAPMGLEGREERLSVGGLLPHRRERLALGEEQVRRQVRRLRLLARDGERGIDVDRDEADDASSPRR